METMLMTLAVDKSCWLTYLALAAAQPVHPVAMLFTQQEWPANYHTAAMQQCQSGLSAQFTKLPSLQIFLLCYLSMHKTSSGRSFIQPDQECHHLGPNLLDKLFLRQQTALCTQKTPMHITSGIHTDLSSPDVYRPNVLKDSTTTCR